MAYPTVAELKTFLLGAGLVTDATIPPDSYLDYQGAIDTATGDWEQYCGWKPFLIDSSDVTRYYDPPNGKVLRFGAGLSTLTSVTVNGTALTLNTDFFLKDENAVADGLPYTYLELLYRQWGLPRSVVIIGKWGRVSTVPAAVKDAVLARSASGLLTQIGLRNSQGGLTESRLEGAITEKYGASNVLAFQNSWDTQFKDTVRAYYRGGIG
jgi:hypothetical protein